MKALVAGLGSIGSRHARNLAALGHEVIGFDPDAERRKGLPNASVASLEEGIAARCDFAVIASPNRFHLAQALAVAAAKMHLFVEKPLASRADGLAALVESVERQQLVAMAGSNWKFHPGLARAKQLIDAGEVGKPLAAQAMGGQYLPDWHPWEDYRKGYSARGDLEGGALLDAHEVDLLVWLLGPIASVDCRMARTGTLEIDTEDLVCMTVAFRSGALGTLQLDYLQHPYRRRVHVTGSKGTLIWDALDNELAHYSSDSKVWRRWKAPLSYDINQMYVDEMRHFVSCIESRAATATPLRHAAHVVAVYDAARKSSAGGGTPQEVPS